MVGEWMGMGVAGIIIDGYCGSFPHSLRLAQARVVFVAQLTYHPLPAARSNFEVWRHVQDFGFVRPQQGAGVGTATEQGLGI